MPNWCSTSFTIQDEKEKLDVFEEEFKKALSANPLNTDFGKDWLGYLLLHIGYDKETVCYGDIVCRGDVGFFDRLSDTTFFISTESAWTPPAECIAKFARHFSDTVEVFYVAEEPGCGLFWTNDPDYEGKCYVDCYIEDEKFAPDWLKALNTGYCYECDADYIVKVLSPVFGEGTVEELADKAMLEDIGDNCISISPYSHMPI